MQSCPSCGELGIREHSVLSPFEELSKQEAASAEPLHTYTRCTRCDAHFHHPSAETLTPAGSEELEERLLSIVPPCKKRGDQTPFEISWDNVEAFFEALSVQLEWIRPLSGLITELRSAGFDSQLRAGQSLNKLGLSRSREDALRPEQSHLLLAPQPDGSLIVDGHVGGRKVQLQAVTAALDGPLRAAIDALTQVPID